MSLHWSLRMASPQLHRNGVYYARLAVPADLQAALGRKENTKSLQTRDPREAASLFKIRMAEVEEEWAALRAGLAVVAEMPRSELPVHALTQKEAHGLAGEIYRRTVAAHQDEPGNPEYWKSKLRHVQRALPAHARVSDIYIPFAGQLHNRPSVQAVRMFGADALALAAEHGFSLDAVGLARLTQAAASASAQAYEVLGRNADGDYSPDNRAGRFPPVELAINNEPAISTEELLTRWKGQPGHAPKTLKAWSGKLRMLMKFAEKDDVSKLTELDVERWRDHRITAGISPTTVAAGDLAGVRMILGWAKDSTLVPEVGVNVADKVRLNKKPKRIRTGSRSFSLVEAETILAASLAPPSGRLNAYGAAARRWVPWLCAYSGARVGEIAQLSGRSVVEVTAENGSKIWCLHLTPEDGTIKTDLARLVPIHPHVIEQGFLKYVKSKGTKPLFYDPAMARDGEAWHRQADKVGERVAAWVRKLGIIRDVQPNHAWRHRFETTCRTNQWRQDIVDSITGHAPETTAAEYGDYLVEVQYDLICRLPRYLETNRIA